MGDLVHLRFAAYGESEVGEVRVSLLVPQAAEEQDEYVLPLTAVFGHPNGMVVRSFAMFLYDLEATKLPVERYRSFEISNVERAVSEYRFHRFSDDGSRRCR